MATPIIMQEVIRRRIASELDELVPDSDMLTGVSTLTRIIQGRDTSQVDFEDGTSIVFQYRTSGYREASGEASYYRDDEFVGTYSFDDSVDEPSDSWTDTNGWNRDIAYLNVLTKVQPSERIEEHAGEALDTAGLVSFNLIQPQRPLRFSKDPGNSLSKIEEGDVFSVQYQ